MNNDDINRGIATKVKDKVLGEEKILQRLEGMGFEIKFCRGTTKHFLSFSNGFLKPEAEPSFLFDFCRFKTEEEAIEFMFSNMQFLSLLKEIDKNLKVSITSVKKIPYKNSYITFIRIGHKCFYKFIKKTKEIRNQLQEQYTELELLKK